MIDGWPWTALRRTRFAVVAFAIMALAAMVAGDRAAAQPCTADSQCRDFGSSRTYCSGNTVVSARSVCIGTCRTVEERREACAGQCLAGRCTGEIRPAPAPRRLPEAVPVPQCIAGCVCRNKILIVTTGRWSAAGDCEQTVTRCIRGCRCDPAPTCR